MAQNSCESCTYYTYDEDYESYMCDINMDEDEYMRLISDQHYQCPYYRNGDEYMVVRKQMQFLINSLSQLPGPEYKLEKHSCPTFIPCVSNAVVN